MLIAIIADTHMPRGGRRLPAGCVERIATADLLLHAGLPAGNIRTERFGPTS
jgi:predicted phosphodiesterase